MELNKKQKKILELLTRRGEIVTTEMAFLIVANLYQTKFYLEELEKAGKIISRKKGKYRYWRLKG